MNRWEGGYDPIYQVNFFFDVDVSKTLEDFIKRRRPIYFLKMFITPNIVGFSGYGFHFCY